MEVDPQPTVICIHRDPLDASSHGRLALGKRPLPKGGLQAGGEPRRLAHGLGHLGLGERIMFQGLQLGLQVLALLVELGQAPIDKLPIGRRDVVQQVAGGAIEAAEAYRLWRPDPAGLPRRALSTRPDPRISIQ